MCEVKDFPPSERDELMGLVTQLQGQVAQLTAANEELHKQIAELKRAGKRQAAPFSKGGRSSRPKRPGRKPGMGSFSYRKSPSPDEVAEPLVEVAVAEDTCPGCGGRLAALYCLLDGVIRHPFLLVAARQLNGNQEDVRRQRAWEALRGENSLHLMNHQSFGQQLDSIKQWDRQFNIDWGFQLDHESAF